MDNAGNEMDRTGRRIPSSQGCPAFPWSRDEDIATPSTNIEPPNLFGRFGLCCPAPPRRRGPAARPAMAKEAGSSCLGSIRVGAGDRFVFHAPRPSTLLDLHPSASAAPSSSMLFWTGKPVVWITSWQKALPARVEQGLAQGPTDLSHSSGLRRRSGGRSDPDYS